MERAIQCTNCGIMTTQKINICDCCGSDSMIEIVLPQEDDYVFCDDEEFTFYDEEEDEFMYTE